MASLFAPAFPSPGSGNSGDQDLTGSADSSEYVMGLAFSVAVAGTLTGIKYYVPTVNQPTNAQFGVGLFDITAGSGSAVQLVHDLVTAPTSVAAGTWVTYTLSTPQALVPAKKYRAAVRLNRYAFSRFVFETSTVVNGNITGLQDDGPGGFPNNAFESTLGPTDFPSPNSSFHAAYYGVDVDIAFTASGTLAATLPAITASVTGGMRDRGTSDPTLPALTGSFAGNLILGGSLGGVLPALSASLTSSIRNRVFETSTVSKYWASPDPFRPYTGGNRLRYRIGIGTTVLFVNGVFVNVTDPGADLVAAATRVYYGGRRYVITAAEMAALVAAGYGSQITLEEI